MKKPIYKNLLGLFVVIIMVVIIEVITTTEACKHDNPLEIVIIKSVSPTCCKAGLTEGMMCNLCGTMVIPQATIPKIDCIESNWIIDIEPTKSENGKRHTECTMCGKLFKEEVIYAGSQGLEYVELSNGNYFISGMGSCTDVDLVIPQMYTESIVTSIGVRAFEYCDTIKSIKIPDSISSIGWGAFYGCSSLTDIVIPHGVTEITVKTFQNCSSLTDITIPNSVMFVDSQSFCGCVSLINIHFEGTVAQWQAIVKGKDWNYKTGNYTVYCTDGNVSK